MRYKNRDLNFYVNAVSCALALITAIVYSIYSPTNKTFLLPVTLFLLLGVVASAVLIFKDIFMLPLVPTLFWSLAFSFFLQDRLMMFGDYANGLPGLSGGGNIIELVIAIMVAMVLCIAAQIFTCFHKAKVK